MPRESIYLDTSVPSSYFDRRNPERMQTTQVFWRDILPNYDTNISEITLEEIDLTPDNELKIKLITLIEPFQLLKTNAEIFSLAESYIEVQILPERYFQDALHVAIASYHKINYLVSWNFKHLVKVKTRRMVKAINILRNFPEIEIISPLEL